MPTHLQKVQGKALYYVVDIYGKKYSKEPLDRQTAIRQKRALDYAHAKKMGYV